MRAMWRGGAEQRRQLAAWQDQETNKVKCKSLDLCFFSSSSSFCFFCCFLQSKNTFINTLQKAYLLQIGAFSPICWGVPFRGPLHGAQLKELQNFLTSNLGCVFTCSGVESEQVRHDFLVFFANSSPKTQAKFKLTDSKSSPCPRPPAPPKSLPGLIDVVWSVCVCVSCALGFFERQKHETDQQGICQDPCIEVGTAQPLFQKFRS